jgi:cytosine/adenosine deaminase-related metal-dependent hydrolase
VDTAQNGLPADSIQTATIFPSTATADTVCANFTNGKTDAYVIHIAEGVDATAQAEFTKLFTITTTDGCLYNPKTAIVHGTALDTPDFAQMAANQMSLVWSPRSNVFLYGGGTDLTRTTDITKALAQGVNVAIAPDWSIGGSQNMLDEMRFADMVDNGRFGDILRPEDIWKMATINAARALGVSAYIGSIEVGKRADIAVFTGDTQKPFDAILAATPREVSMVFVDGRFLYGDATVQGVGADDAICEQLMICCRSKTACIAETGGTPADKTGQKITDIEQALDTAMTSYDALMMTQWTFAPTAPLVKCQ